VAINRWRWYHIVFVWIVVLVTSIALLAAYTQKHASQSASSGSFDASFVEVIWPVWVLVLIAVLVVSLVTLTTMWVRATKKAGTTLPASVGWST
jgi:heme/copper-type cytochrome/quinol oxidase subunit 2